MKYFIRYTISFRLVSIILFLIRDIRDNSSSLYLRYSDITS